MKPDHQEALDRITRARVGMLLDNPFFGSLTMHLRAVVDETRPTFSTDGKSLHFNPKFLDQLSDAELKTVLAHEVMHCALMHPYRRGARDLNKFNIAADYAVNNFLDNTNKGYEAKGETPPFVFTGPLAKVYLDHQYDGLSAEEIYHRLIDPPQSGGGNGQPQPQPGAGQSGGGQPGNKPGKGRPNSQPSTNNPQPSPGEFTDGAGAEDEASREEAESDWKVAVQQAALGAKAKGRLPAEAERYVEELLNPKLPWQEILRQFLTATAKEDYSWARPNRRYASAGVILPGMHSPRLGKVIVAVDTSGSIGQAEFDAFMSEVQGILFNCQPETFVLAQCDARLHDWQELDLFADVAKIECKGGGGTSFKPVFERAEEDCAAGAPPAALIYLTDLDGDFPKDEPGYPVLWASTSPKDKQAPFGITLPLE
jgi:predicted metal-dependent peptidase